MLGLKLIHVSKRGPRDAGLMSLSISSILLIFQLSQSSNTGYLFDITLIFNRCHCRSTYLSLKTSSHYLNQCWLVTVPQEYTAMKSPTGDSPTTSEGSTILSPIKVPLILEVRQYLQTRMETHFDCRAGSLSMTLTLGLITSSKLGFLLSASVNFLFVAFSGLSAFFLPATINSEVISTSLKSDMSTAHRRLKSPQSLYGASTYIATAPWLPMGHGHEWSTHSPFVPCQSAHPPPIQRRLFQTLTLKLQGQCQGRGQRSRSNSSPSIQPMHLLFVSHQSDHSLLRYVQ